MVVDVCTCEIRQGSQRQFCNNLINPARFSPSKFSERRPIPYARNEEYRHHQIGFVTGRFLTLWVQL